MNNAIQRIEDKLESPKHHETAKFSKHAPITYFGAFRPINALQKNLGRARKTRFWNPCQTIATVLFVTIQPPYVEG